MYHKHGKQRTGRGSTSMGCHDDAHGVCEHEEVLDIISEFVLIAQYCAQHDTEKKEEDDIKHDIHLGNTRYINGPLRQRLGYIKGSLPPPCRYASILTKRV